VSTKVSMSMLRAVFFTEQDGRLTFFSKWVERPMPGKTGAYVTQVAVERNKELAPTGLVDHVFWQYLIPLCGAVMTDSFQTSRGKEFGVAKFTWH